MQPSTDRPSTLLLPPVFEALETWLVSSTPVEAAAVGNAIAEVGRRMGLDVGRLRITAPPLPDLDVNIDGTAGAEYPLRVSHEAAPIGSVRIGGDRSQATTLVHTLELLFESVRARARADRSARQLAALDQAVRGIGGVLELDRVLQLIVDHVRDLVDAQYAALGIVDRDGVIERFITSGIDDEARRRIGELPHGRGLLGLIIRENRAYRIPDIATHPQRYGFPPNHPEMHSFLGLPITAGGSVVGRLYLTNKVAANEFSAEDQAMVEMFALHAGIAIQNARLHDQVRRLAVVDERDRISRDLHDSVIQALYGQTLALDDVPDLIEEDPAEAARRVDDAIDALHATIRDIRNFIFGLRPVLLETGSLADGLRHLATELHRNGGVEVSVDVPETDTDELPLEVVAELLAVTREALSNVARHASASRASIELRATPEAVRLELADNGTGFAVEQAAERGHHGLANMRARTAALGGTFEVDSRPDVGTRIILSVPRRHASAEGEG